MKPCPNPWGVDHGDSQPMQRLTEGLWYRFYCPCCGTVSPIKPTIPQAIEAWNTRPHPAPSENGTDGEGQLIEKMVGVLIRIPIFHRCAFPNAADFERCLSCAADAVLKEYNERNKPLPNSGTGRARPSEVGELTEAGIESFRKSMKISLGLPPNASYQKLDKLCDMALAQQKYLRGKA